MPGASVPPEAALITVAPVVWTLGPENREEPGNFYFLRDGKRVDDASGSKIMECKGEPWFYGRRGSWWRFTDSWVNTNSAVMPCTP